MTRDIPFAHRVNRPGPTWRTVVVRLTEVYVISTTDSWRPPPQSATTSARRRSSPDDPVPPAATRRVVDRRDQRRTGCPTPPLRSTNHQRTPRPGPCAGIDQVVGGIDETSRRRLGHIRSRAPYRAGPHEHYGRLGNLFRVYQAFATLRQLALVWAITTAARARSDKAANQYARSEMAVQVVRFYVLRGTW